MTIKNIFKKVLFLASLSFVLFGNNFIFAEGLEGQPDVILDTQIPVISILGETNISINVGESYSDLGATAEDNIDGDLTSMIVIVSNVDFNTAGIYHVTYDVKDAALNSAVQVIRTVTVNEVVSTPEELKEQVVIRNGDTVVYDGFYNLPNEGTVEIPDKDNIAHSINSRSVLAVLYEIDKTNDNFSISTLEYNSSYDSLYMKCLTPNGGDGLCDNWQYVVNNSYPFVGMDKNILNGNEKIYIYFGQQNRVLLNKNSIDTKDELVVTAEKYDYENNSWLSRTGVTVGVTKPDPNNPWSPNDEIQSLVDPITGIAKFSSLPEGEYNVGIKEDYYWPTESLIVKRAQESSGNSSTPIGKNFSISQAFDFLDKNKKDDGSYGDSMYTDWVAIAASAGNNQNLKTSLSNYLKSDSVRGEVITDYERRAMALMALGINPYSGTDLDYIKKIIDSFDGVQFGDNSLVNDDIFALIVLKNAGYGLEDEIISKDVNYLISKHSNDSWGSVDMTSAGIQALSGFENMDGVEDSISEAEDYLVTSQNSDGGFGNSFSTSWALQVLSVEDNISRAKDYLASKQQTDGGVEELSSDTNTRVWATAYSIPAILQKSWDEILNNFSKVIYSSSSESGDNLEEEVVDPTIKEDIKIEKIDEKTKNITSDDLKEVSLAKNENVKKVETVKKNIVLEKKEDNNTSALTASVASVPEVENNSFLSAIHSILLKIKAPFVWLFVKLGF